MNPHPFPSRSRLAACLLSCACASSLHAFTATLELTPVLEADAATHPLTAIYASEAPIDLTTLDDDDLVVGRGTLFRPEIEGVDGSEVRLISHVVEDEGKWVRANYEVTRPTSGWTMNGTARRDLQVAVRADEVKDMEGKGVELSSEWLIIEIESDEDPSQSPKPSVRVLVTSDAEVIRSLDQESVTLQVTYQKSDGAAFNTDSLSDDDLLVGWQPTLFRPDAPGTMISARLLNYAVEAEGRTLRAVYQVDRPDFGWDGWERTSLQVILKEGSLTLVDGSPVIGIALSHIIIDFELKLLPQIVGLDGWIDALEDSLDVENIFSADGDADGDGLSDLTEFILDTHPLDPTDAVTLVPGAIRVDDHVFVQYRFNRRKHGFGVVTEVQASRDGRAWESADLYFNLQSNEEVSETTEELTFRSRLPASTVESFLFRIKVAETGNDG